MDKQKWGRRRSDNQPYPKTRGKESLPTGLTPVSKTGRRHRYRVPFSLTRDLGYGPETGMSHINVKAVSRKQAISLSAKLLGEKYPDGKIRIKPDSVKLQKGIKRGSKTTRRRKAGQRGYSIPYTWVLPNGKTHTGRGKVIASSRDEAVEKTTKFVERLHPTAKIRINRDGIRTRKLYAGEHNNPCPTKKEVT